MTAKNFTDRVGLAKRTLEWYQRNADVLSQKGLNASYWTAQLTALIDAVVTADAKQEALKAELKATTAIVEDYEHRMYEMTSGALDAAIGAHGKSSAEGQMLARMRSKLHQAPSNAEIQPV